MIQFRKQYMKLKNDYDELSKKYELCKKIALQQVERDECIDRKDTYCHVCERTLSCPISLHVHLQSNRHLGNVKSFYQN